MVSSEAVTFDYGGNQISASYGAVPEPATGVLLGLVMLAFCLRRRK